MSTMTLFLQFLLFTLTIYTKPSNSALDSLVYGNCSQLKFTPNSPYENNVNSLLTSMVNSAAFTNYNNFTIQSPPSQYNTLYGLFQCRGDLGGGDCSRCVARAVTQLGTLCLNSTGGVLQLDGCLVKYDNATFLGVNDETVVLKKCGPSIGYNSDALTRRDTLLGYLAAGDGSRKPYRTGTYDDIYGYAQYVGDLCGSECQDCLSEAIQLLKADCGPSAAGDIYLVMCYVRFSVGGADSQGRNGADSHGENNKNHNDDEIEKTPIILIGVIVGVALLIMLVYFLSKLIGKEDKSGNVDEIEKTRTTMMTSFGLFAGLALLINSLFFSGRRQGLSTETPLNTKGRIKASFERTDLVPVTIPSTEIEFEFKTEPDLT